MRLSRRSFCRLAAASAVLPFGAVPAVAKSVCVAAPIKASFLQLLSAHKALTVAQWEERLALYQRFGITTLYLQWTELNGVSFVERESSSVLARLLSAAETRAMNIHVGLIAATRDPAAESPTAFARLLKERRKAAYELARQIVDHSESTAFAGWYLPAEIHDAGWIQHDRRDAAAEHLVHATHELRALTPDHPVSVSTFATGTASVTDWSDFWLRVWLQAPLRVMLQDGQGVHALPEQRMRLYKQALSAAAASLQRDWAIVVEMFQQTSGPPVDHGPFKARPASFERLERQIRQAGAFPDAELVAFTVPDYLLRPGSGEPTQLGLDYAARYCEA